MNLTSVAKIFKTNILVFIFLLSFTKNSKAQVLEFGEVSKSELLKTESSIDSTAGAEILYYNKEVYFNASFTFVNLISVHDKKYNSLKFSKL